MSEFHVFPLGDLVKHTLDGTDCACGPRVDFVPDPDGGDRWIYVHHSLDDRETSE